MNYKREIYNIIRIFYNHDRKKIKKWYNTKNGFISDDWYKSKTPQELLNKGKEKMIYNELKKIWDSM